MGKEQDRAKVQRERSRVRLGAAWSERSEEVYFLAFYNTIISRNLISLPHLLHKASGTTFSF